MCRLKIHKLLISVFVFILLAVLIPAQVAYAADDPDDVSLDNIIIFNSLIVEDDFLAYVPYTISFTEPPDEGIDKTFIFRMISENGTTEYGVNIATAQYNSGYGSGIVSFYIDTGMSFTEDYIFRVQENPAYYDEPQYWDFQINDSNFSTATDQEAALRAKIIDSATSLSIEYEVSLLSRSEAGQTVLSTYGELYFLEAIPGLQVMCNSIFELKTEDPDFTKRTWSTTFADALKTKYEDTFIEDFMTGFAGLFSIETSPAMNFLSAILFIALIFLSVWKFKGTTTSALLDGYALLELLMLMGFFSMIWAGFIAFISSGIGGAILFFKRS